MQVAGRVDPTLADQPGERDRAEVGEEQEQGPECLLGRAGLERQPDDRERRDQGDRDRDTSAKDPTAPVASAAIVMAIYRVRTTAVQGLGSTHGHPRLAVAVVVAFVIVLAAPLAVDSAQITSQQLTNSNMTAVANNWANTVGWQVVNVSSTETGVTVRAIGPLPLPNPQT